MVDKILQTVRFDPLAVEPLDFEPSPVSPGDYELRFLAGGTVLNSISFAPRDPIEPSPDPSRSGEAAFNVAVPENPRVDLIEILQNGQAIGNLQRSVASPSVQVLLPNGGEFFDRLITLAWAASDPDGDPLSATLEYSSDSGATWRVLATDVPTTQFSVDSTRLPGGVHGVVRVTVSDGFRSAFDQSDAEFVVLRKAPFVQMLSPVDGAEYTRDQPISLRGMGNDLEDGDVPDAAYMWSSSLDGQIGMGANASVVASTLSEGTHVISLVVRDSDNLTSAVHRTMTVTRAAFPSNIPPVSDAGPDRTVMCASSAGTPVILDGASSSDANGDPLIFTWTGPFTEGGGVVSGATPTVTLPVGTHTISLSVSDGFGGMTSDSLQVTVVAAPETCDDADNNCDGMIDNGADPPPNTAGFAFTSKSDFAWAPTPGGATYDIVKGDLGALRSSGGSFSNSLLDCLADGSPDLTGSDTADPSAGGGYYYLVRAFGCGQNGTYDDLGGQQGTRDAGVAGSLSPCP